MTHQEQGITTEAALKILEENGLDGMAEILSVILNQVMILERTQHMNAQPYERTNSRMDYANGFKDKTLATRTGKLALRIPQTRSGQFYPSTIEKGIRSERALKATIAEMYLNGVSTRKVERITRELCGMEISSTQVSRLTKQLDEEFDKWRNRSLNQCPVVWLDAHYEKVRIEGCVMDVAVLKAIGVQEDGKRSILGLSVSLSEAEVHWRSFLESLVARGMKGVRLFVSDDHSGLKEARKSIFPSIPWQRCLFHMQRNAAYHCSKQSSREQVCTDIKRIYSAYSLEVAQSLLKEIVKKWEKKDSHLASWLEENLPEGMTFFKFPRTYWRKIRTSNLIEMINKQVRKRTRVAGLFPNTDSLLRLCSAVLIEISDDWESGRKYLTISNEVTEATQIDSEIYRKEVA